MQIFVKLFGFGSSSRCFEVEPDESVESLRERVSKWLNDWPLESCKLIFNSKFIEDGKTLDDYGMKNESTVLVATRIDIESPPPTKPRETPSLLMRPTSR